MILKLVRHGESQLQSGEVKRCSTPDHLISLTSRGIDQAREVGKKIGLSFFLKGLLYTSPYLRARQTLMFALDEAGAFPHYETKQRQRLFYEDPRLREVEHGYGKEDAVMDREEELRDIQGYFYYRYKEGESPADCYDRISTFLESLKRQLDRKNASRCVIFSHGLTIRCIVMRWLHLTVEQFNGLHNLDNGDIVTITAKDALTSPQFVSGKWGVEGLRLRKKP